ncbi:MAG: cardiolipin synthase [Proteobacteria bacterium]|nr:cardiolipin synthase [Pseudomonadota bacterium]
MGFLGAQDIGPNGHLILLIQAIAVASLAVHVLLRKQDPQVCMGWLLAIAMFPMLAGILYVVIGINPFERLAERKRRSRRETRQRQAEASQVNVESQNNGLLEAAHLSNFSRTLKWISHFGSQARVEGNELELLVNSNQVFPRLEQSILDAKSYIVLQFYQIQADAVGINFLNLLEKKAQSGVKVYVLYDALGSISLTDVMIRRYRDAGIAMNKFLEIHPIKRRFQVNWRNHRKLVVIDGTEAFVGGFNIGSTYVQGDNLEKPKWVDVLFSIKGPAISELLRIFFEDWHFTTGDSLAGVLSAVDADVQVETRELTLLTVVASGPTENTAPFYSTVLNILFEAKNSVWIMTPYLVPDRALLHAMRLAVGRGVHVKIIVPKVSNHPLTDLCSSSYFSEIHSYGIELVRYKYGVCHGKIILADDDLIFSGSSNMDYRSFFLNFETDLFIRDKVLGAKIKELFSRVSAMSEPLTEVDLSAKPLTRLLMRRLMRLVAPLM